MENLRFPSARGSSRSAVSALSLALGKLPRVGTVDLARRNYAVPDPLTASVLAHVWEWGSGGLCPGWDYLQGEGYADGWLLFFARSIALAGEFGDPQLREYFPKIGRTIAGCAGAVPATLENKYRTARDPRSLEALVRSRLALGSVGGSQTLMRWRLYRLALAGLKVSSVEVDAIRRANPHLKDYAAPVVRTPAGTYIEIEQSLKLSNRLCIEDPSSTSFSRRGMYLTRAWTQTAGRKLLLNGPTDKHLLIRWFEEGDAERRAEWFLSKTFWSPTREDTAKLSGWANGRPLSGWSRQDLPDLAKSVLYWAG